MPLTRRQRTRARRSNRVNSRARCNRSRAQKYKTTSRRMSRTYSMNRRGNSLVGGRRGKSVKTLKGMGGMQTTGALLGAGGENEGQRGTLSVEALGANDGVGLGSKDSELLEAHAGAAQDIEGKEHEGRVRPTPSTSPPLLSSGNIKIKKRGTSVLYDALLKNYKTYEYQLYQNMLKYKDPSGSKWSEIPFSSSGTRLSQLIVDTDNTWHQGKFTKKNSYDLTSGNRSYCICSAQESSYSDEFVSFISVLKECIASVHGDQSVAAPAPASSAEVDNAVISSTQTPM